MGNKLKVGDTIRCAGAADMVSHMYLLASMNIETDFMYQKDGEKGYWLVVTEVPDSEKEKADI